MIVALSLCPQLGRKYWLLPNLHSNMDNRWIGLLTRPKLLSGDKQNDFIAYLKIILFH